MTVIGELKEKDSGRSVLMSGEIYNSEAVLCAHAKAEFKALDPKVALRLGLVSKEYMLMFEPILSFNYDSVS